jgi:hypothetical protein
VVCQWLQLKFLQGRFPGSNPAGRFQDDHAEIGNKEHRQNILCFLEELMNIENRVAWFLAELCKAEKGVQEDMRNQRLTELVRGVFSASRSTGKHLLSLNIISIFNINVYPVLTHKHYNLHFIFFS